MSIVPEEKIKHDPQTLLYHFPSMHPVRYQQLANDFQHWKQVQIAEKVAEICGRRLIPAACLHWQRKMSFENRKITIKKHAYYVLSPEEMTNTESRKYQDITREGTGDDPDRRELFN